MLNKILGSIGSQAAKLHYFLCVNGYNFNSDSDTVVKTYVVRNSNAALISFLDKNRISYNMDNSVLYIGALV